ncbi:FabD/lysophospholipase-like protein, partial [Myriangium duriaei CBS 260.36]
MIGGTNIGGLIAIMLGRLEMNVDECIEQYFALPNSVFHTTAFSSCNSATCDHDALEEAVKHLLLSKGLDQDTLLKNSDSMSCKTFVVATSAGSTAPEVLSSYYRQRGPAELYDTAKIWEAVRATSAKPNLFEPIDIGPSRRRFFDGGSGANNPVFLACEEAKDLFCMGQSLERKINCLISVGCGIKSLERFGETDASLYRTLAWIVDETERTARQFLRVKADLFDNGRYYRFSAPCVGDVDKRMSVMQMTDHYIDSK